MSRATCPLCGAPVWWVNAVGGGAVPLDPEPVVDGRIAVARRHGQDIGRDYVADDGDVARYSPHALTCRQRGLF